RTATGMVTAMARLPASRRLRSRMRCPRNEGPTPRPAAAGSGVSIASSLLGFDYFGAEAIEECPAFFGGPFRVLLLPCVSDFERFEEEVVTLLGRRRVGRAPQLLLRANRVAARQPRHRHPARLAAVLLRIEAVPVLVRSKRGVISACK